MGKGGHLTREELTNILNGNTAQYFIESGTYLGHSTHAASHLFEHVYTIELKHELSFHAQERCKDRTNISFHIGDSVNILPVICDIILPLHNGSYVWFLDAHQSGSETSNNGKWVPLMDELRILCKKISQYNNEQRHIFIIDDVRLFGEHWDWKEVSIQGICKTIYENGLNIKSKNILNDRFIIYI